MKFNLTTALQEAGNSAVIRRTQVCRLVAALVAGGLLGAAQAQTLPGMGGATGAPRTEAPTTSAPAQAAAAPAGSQAKAVVKGVRFTGNEVFSSDVLRAVVAPAMSSSMDLEGLRGLADLVTRHYRKAGYAVARAFVPAQSSVDGVVQINVVEGRVGQIVVQGAGEQTISQERAKAVAQAALCDSPEAGCSNVLIQQEKVDRALLLLRDLPGVSAAGQLSPGTQVGTSNLTVNLTPSNASTTGVDVDNYGSKFLGRARVGGYTSWNNPSGRGDRLSADFLTSGAGNNTGGIGYSVPVGYYGTRVGIGIAKSQYRVGAEFTSAEAYGLSTAYSLFTVHPLVRQVTRTAHMRVTYENGFSRSSIGGVNYESRGVTLRAGVIGDSLDNFGGAGYTTYQLNLASGAVVLPVGSAAADATTSRINGGWNKISYGLARQQSLGAGASLFAAFNGQHAGKNLSGGEMMGLGGATGVRAYPWGEAAGSHAGVLNLELRHTQSLASTAAPVNMTWSAFYDIGTSMAYPNAWAGNPSNWRMLRGYGFGLAFESKLYYTRMSYAMHAPEAASLVEPGSNGRLWLQAGYRF